MKKSSVMFDQFTPLDKRLILSSCIFSAVFFVLWMNYIPKIKSRDFKVIATLAKPEQDVRWKLNGNFEWVKPLLSVGLGEGDQIFTGDNSVATVNFITSKSTLTLKPNTLITIEEYDDKVLMNIEKGQADVILEKGQEILVQSGKKVQSIKNEAKEEETPIAIKKPITRPIQIKSVGGNVSVVSQDQAVAIKQVVLSESVNAPKVIALEETVKPAAKVADTEPIIVPPIEERKKFEFPKIMGPNNGQVIMIGQSNNLKLAAPFNGKVEVAKASNFSNLEKEISINGSDLILPAFPIGDYFLRLRKEIDVSESVAFKIVGTKSADLISPKDKEEIILARNGEIEFSWISNSKFDERIEIRNSSGVVKDVLVKNGSYKTRLSGDQDFSWKIKTVQGEEVMTESSTNNFRLWYGPLVFKEVPKDLYTISDKKINASWNAADSEEVKVSIFDEINKTEFLSKIVTGSKFSVDVTPAGRYTLRANSKIFPSKEDLAKSYMVKAPILKFTGVEKINGNKVQEKESEISVYEADGEIVVGFTQPAVAPSKMNIKLAIDGKDESKKLSANSSNLEIDFNKFGNYCFSALAGEEVKDDIFLPVNYCVRISKKAAFANLVKAPDQVMEYDGKEEEESYVLTAPERKEAAEYRFFVYKDSKAKELIHSAKSKINKTNWASSRSGVYYFRYQLVDEKGRESDMSPISKIIFPISPLSEW